MMRVQLNPGLLRWARERAGFDLDYLAKRFPRLGLWERGETNPTLKQIEKFAKAVYVPVGYLFMPKPPIEHIPIPDFRARGNEHKAHPSPDLLDTIYVCQQRQEWYRDFARSAGEEPLPFAGSVSVKDNIVGIAANIRNALGFDLEERRETRTWTKALRRFIQQADALGILIMCSGVVLNNTHRGLNPDEFRGFAMADDLAPLIFINGADTKAAQMFTLAHELAHIWLGQSALSDTQASLMPEDNVERWCNQVAAELLVPLAVLRDEYQAHMGIRDEMDRLARRFKVSTLVVLRRIYDARGLTRNHFWKIYGEELERLCAFPKRKGGDFYLTQPVRVSKRFARALIVSTLEGQTLHRDAFRMLGVRKLETFKELGRHLGVLV